MNTAVYECPECGDKKLLDYSEELPPTMWCGCEGFNIMEVDHKNED
jgi:hypothetical protein